MIITIKFITNLEKERMKESLKAATPIFKELAMVDPHTWRELTSVFKEERDTETGVNKIGRSLLKRLGGGRRSIF